MRGVIERLRENPRTRQAAAVIWEPNDAVRPPFDIPCALAVAYHWRDDGLSATTVMRSNKPLTLLPFNIFEFSMLGEAIAAELEVEFTRYVHFMLIAQLPEVDVSRADLMISSPRSKSLEMTPMPTDPPPLAQLQTLLAVERQIRAAGNYDAARRAVRAAATGLHPYWLALAALLAMRWLTMTGSWPTLRDEATDLLPASLALPLRQLATVRQEQMVGEK